MVKYNEDETKTLHCDRCGIQLTENFIFQDSGDILCEECFEKEHRIMSADEYLKKL